MKKIERQSMTARAIEILRSSIIAGDLKMGAPLMETELSEMLGISRTPIREALSKLQSEGLVVVRPYRGTTVFTVTGDELVDLVDYREVIEVAALRRAMAFRQKELLIACEDVIKRMKVTVENEDLRAYLILDQELHNTLVCSSGSRCLMDGYSLIEAKMAALRTALAQTTSRILASFDSHEELLELIRKKRTEEACALLQLHVQDGKQLFSSGPGVITGMTPERSEAEEVSVTG
ncbi:GntR family transcriptional regulator [uncultured Cohaesibacter sp.]|uniref:GntR family transcriptional regulator n=1 Tax=uncultured Cohaesibacter sp. TaxID=1002546 RepID=UPI002931AD4E|nr:GntR family transcriptional regulator [uncultured Cohaesibacter sp.]